MEKLAGDVNEWPTYHTLSIANTYFCMYDSQQGYLINIVNT